MRNRVVSEFWSGGCEVAGTKQIIIKFLWYDLIPRKGEILRHWNSTNR